MDNNLMRENRLKYGITFKDLADKTFVPIGMLREWEQGESKPRDREAAARVAKMIKCSTKEIFGF